MKHISGGNFVSRKQHAQYMYKLSIFLFQVILLLVLLAMRKRISLVVVLFQEASSCVASVPTMMVQPVLTYFILILYFVYWVIILAYLSTAGTDNDSHWFEDSF